MMAKKKLRRSPREKTYKDRDLDFEACSEEYKPFKTAWEIAAMYVIVGSTWILLSDRILYAIPLSSELLSSISMVKGWGYVLATGILLFIVIYKSFNKIRRINQILLANYEELIATDQELQEKIQRLSESEERYRMVSEATNDGIWDEKDGKRHFSERWYNITGYSKEDIDRIEDWMSLIHPEDIDRVKQELLKNRQNREPYYSCEYRLKFKSGEYRWILSKARLIFDEKGNIIRSAGSHTDITVLKESQERLRQLAYKDFLTNLPNRVSFIKDALESISEHPDKNKAVIFFDVDSFKLINDTVGHIMGDQLIIGIGERLKGLVDDNKSAYRNSGDEFVVFVHEYQDIEEIEVFTKKLIERISAPFNLNNHVLNITISIGIALYPIHGKDVDTLLKCADIAMYRSKSNDRGGYTFYHRSFEDRFKERMILGNELSGALDRNEFELHYQPQIDISSDKIIKLEALLRWRSQKLGTVPPLSFIEIAEETHLINPIGDWVIDRACRFLKKLHSKGYMDISVSVNVSIIQLMQQDFLDKLVNTLGYHGIDPKFLELEVTESVFIESYSNIKDKLEKLMSLGISIALDDFGTGYSSLSNLAAMPIDTLKIDKSFIDTIGNDTKESCLTGTIITIGHQLGLSVVAEGVETREQLEYLKTHKCHKAQGYYFSKPLPPIQILDLLDRQNGRQKLQ